MSKTRTENEAPYHKYFTQMLNIAEDDLDPFQYRLLAHYVRWTGQGGESDESIRKAAKATKMGVNKVRSTLDELVALKYITVERPTPEEARNGKTIHIIILDRWEDNILRYKKAVSNPIQDNVKPVSKTIHPPVSNQIRIEEQHTEEQKEDFASKAASTKKTTIPASQMNAMKDAIVAAFGWEVKTITKPTWGIIQTTAKELCEAGFEAECIGAYYSWCASKFTHFTPRALSTNLAEYSAHHSKTKSNLAPQSTPPVYKPSAKVQQREAEFQEWMKKGQPMNEEEF